MWRLPVCRNTLRSRRFPACCVPAHPGQGSQPETWVRKTRRDGCMVPVCASDANSRQVMGSAPSQHRRQRPHSPIGGTQACRQRSTGPGDGQAESRQWRRRATCRTPPSLQQGHEHPLACVVRVVGHRSHSAMRTCRQQAKSPPHHRLEEQMDDTTPQDGNYRQNVPGRDSGRIGERQPLTAPAVRPCMNWRWKMM